MHPVIVGLAAASASAAAARAGDRVSGACTRLTDDDHQQAGDEWFGRDIKTTILCAEQHAA